MRKISRNSALSQIDKQSHCDIISNTLFIDREETKLADDEDKELMVELDTLVQQVNLEDLGEDIRTRSRRLNEICLAIGMQTETNYDGWFGRIEADRLRVELYDLCAKYVQLYNKQLDTTLQIEAVLFYDDAFALTSI